MYYLQESVKDIHLYIMSLTFNMVAVTLVVGPEVLIADAISSAFRVIAMTVSCAGSALVIQYTGLTQITSCPTVGPNINKIETFSIHV